VVLEILSSSPELQIADVADGDYFMRVRAVDAHGLEGYDSTHAFRLKAHPEPPLILNPMPRGKVRAREVEFKWRERTEAAAYHLQIAKDATFTALVLDDKALRGGQAIVGKLALGAYFWRVASLRKDGDRGPFGDVAQFTLLAPPATPTPPSIGDTHINFRWAGEPGQTFEFQIANNSAFEKPILLQTLNSPEIDVPLPRPGPYYMRYRAIDSDGFVGPYIPPQRFMVPEPPFPHSYPAQWMPLYTPN